MVMSRSTAVGSVVTGSILLGFAILAVICGAISANKLSGEVAASAGLWSLYFAVPGILCIVAGATKSGIVMGFALCFNIFAVIISSVASIFLIIITIAMNEFASDYKSYCINAGDRCECVYSKYDHSHTETDYDVSWNMKCSDLSTVYSLFIAALVAYIILTVTSFTASIFGCLGTCCAPVDPIVVVTAGVPVHTGGTVVVSSNQSSMMHSGYPGAVAPAYGHMHPPAYGHGDKSGLVQNMAI